MKRALLAVALAAQAFVAAAAPQVELKTTAGTIVVDLNGEKAPKTVANFVEYVKAGHYNGVIFHRVIDGFMIQGGGFTPDMKEKPTRTPIQSESKNGLKNDAGTLAMARTQDPHSASAQFFINLVDNAPLNYPSPDGWGYTVFGKVVSGMDVVRKIGQTATGNRGFYRDVPLEPIVIQSARVLPDAPAAK